MSDIAHDILTLGLVQQKIIRNEEYCQVIIEGKQIKANSRKSKKSRFLVWIKNKNQPLESALLVVRKKKANHEWNVQDVFLLTADFKISRKSSTTYEFYKGATSIFNFETSESENMSSIIRALQNAQKSAQSGEFSWIDFYLNRKNKTVSDESSSSNYKVDDGTSEIEVEMNQYSFSNVTDVKESWINSQMKARESEFTQTKTISIFCGTWNVNGKKPSESLQPWLTKDLAIFPDIYAIAFQELDLSAENFLLGSTPLETIWADHVANTLKSSKHKYIMLETKRLVGILLLVFIKEEHLSFIYNVQTGIATTGIMNMMGNKGGVAIRFNFKDSSFCFVNSHLNAHHDNVERRNQDYHEISRRTLFQNLEGVPSVTIFKHDYLFWIGDLNYRIMLPDNEIRDKIIKEDYAPLIDNDQLKIQMRKGTAFGGFNEGTIKFAPTYKYDTGTNNYDTSEKHRAPAWCDRVLWKAPDVNLLSYGRHELLSSDHRPVSATFEVKVKATIPDAKGKVYQDIVRHLDKLENESRPSASVDTNAVDFGNVTYMSPVTRTVLLENTGRVVAKYQFIPKLNEKKFCKQWLFINPPFGLLVPGEKLEIKFTVHIDNSTVLDFNLEKEKLEDILILHLNGGLDFFISLSGTYLPSSFGSLLTYLVRYPGPVRTSKPVPTDFPDCLNIPKELWRIIDYIYRKGMDEENLFLQTGVHSELQLIRECLDTGESFDGRKFDIHSMAECLINFLDSLGESVIPYSLYGQVLECTSPLQAKNFLNNLNKVHYNVFYYLISFLKEVLSHSHNNKLSIDKIAVLFSSVLIRPSRKDTINQQNDQNTEFVVRKKAAYIEHFLRSSRSESPVTNFNVSLPNFVDE